jgi:hypothetical protein
MKKLTVTQQAIIDNLLIEFKGMNEVNSIPFTLFNAQPILAELSAKEIERKETVLHNRAKEIERKETVLHNRAKEIELIDRLNKYVDILNNDFDNANLPIKANLSGGTIHITGDVSKMGRMDNNDDVRLYTIKMYSITKNNYSKTTAYHYANDTYTDNRFNTIEELLETTVFKSKIQNLIEKTIKASKK